MAVEILPLGGLGEVGKNMTAIGFDGEYVIVDMGLRLDTILSSFEDVDIGVLGREELINMDGIPNDAPVRGKDVKAILLTHGHLDHVGAVAKLAHAYRAPIYGMPFTLAIVKHLISEEQTFRVPNELRAVEQGEAITLDGVGCEFINVTHSIPQTSAVVLRHDGESVLCASDFKLDESPLLGEATNRGRLKELARDGLGAALVGTVRLDEEGPTPSESSVRERLGEVIGEAASSAQAVVVTTFSSHIARVKSIVDISYEVGRTPVVLGRSLRGYCSAAAELGIVDFPEELRIHGRSNAVYNALREVGGARTDYLLLATGHQGEPNSLLVRIADGKTPLKIAKGDEVIFSASVIPNPINRTNRELLEVKLLAQGARVRRDVHASGHAGRRDTREFLELIRPEHLIPCHGTTDKLEMLADMALELGFSSDRVHLLRNGQSLRLGD